MVWDVCYKPWKEQFVDVVEAGYKSAPALSCATFVCCVSRIYIITPSPPSPNASLYYGKTHDGRSNGSGLGMQLDMPPEVAGVTFLAFGNGAPDVFSSIAALTSTSNIEASLLVGMGSLLGAGTTAGRAGG